METLLTKDTPYYIDDYIGKYKLIHKDPAVTLYIYCPQKN